MRKVFDEIKEIDLNIDNCSLPEAICKFSEESGEMIREMNKYFGRKKTSENEETIRENVKEEIADTIQNLFILTHRFNISYEELEKEIERKNGVWKNKKQ